MFNWLGAFWKHLIPQNQSILNKSLSLQVAEENDPIRPRNFLRGAFSRAGFVASCVRKHEAGLVFLDEIESNSLQSHQSQDEWDQISGFKFEACIPISVTIRPLFQERGMYEHIITAIVRI